MHGTIMVFLAIVPLAFAAFGNYVVPLQIGAPDMAFPRINMVSYQAFVLGGIIMFVSFFIPGGAAQAGWTSYSPLATSIPTMGQTFWLIGMIFLITSSLLGAVNFIATIIQLRAPGMTWMRLPFFVWAQFVTAFLLLLAFPPLEAAGIMQLMDKVAGTSFFLPDRPGGRRSDGQHQRRRKPSAVAASVLVSGHPEVYVLILPAMGIVCRDDRQQHAQADLGLQVARLLGARDWFPLVHRLGASHVSDGHGHESGHVLSDDDDDHFDSVGHHSDVSFDLAVGRFDSVQHSDAFCDGVPCRCSALAV